MDDDAAEQDRDIYRPGNTLCGTVWWSRLVRVVREAPLSWCIHASVAGGSLLTLMCCMLYAAEYMDWVSTAFVCLGDAAQCLAYYARHRDVVWRNCFAPSQSRLNRLMSLCLYPLPVGFKLAALWLIAHAVDRTSAAGAAGAALIYHWTMYGTTQLCLWDDDAKRGRIK